MAECTENDKTRLAHVESSSSSAHKRIDDTHTWVEKVEGRTEGIWSRVMDNETKYMDAVPKAHQAHKATVEMSVMLGNITEQLKALQDRNDRVDGRDETFIKEITKSVNALQIWMTVFKVIGAVLLTSLLPFFAWIVLSILEPKEHSHEVPPATTTNNKVKVKTEKKEDSE